LLLLPPFDCCLPSQLLCRPHPWFVQAEYGGPAEGGWDEGEWESGENEEGRGMGRSLLQREIKAQRVSLDVKVKRSVWREGRV
jgi:hypothetical protein